MKSLLAHSILSRAQWPVAAWWLVVAAALVGCSSGPSPVAEPRPGPTVEAELPSYAELRAMHNERVARLDRLWSRMSFVVRRPDPDDPDNVLSDQAEGNVQIERPRRVAISMTKLGELFFILGSNDDLYWWVDRTDKRSPVVLFGRHELAGPASLEWLGVNVAPLEFIDLFGITPLPDVEEGVGAWVRSDAPGTVSAIVPSRFGYRSLVFDASDRTLLGVEMLDQSGEVLAQAELGRPRRAPVEGDGTPGELMGTRIRMTFPLEDVFVSVELAEQSNRTLNPGVFDFDRILRSYGRNGTVYDLDAQPEQLGQGR